MTSIETKYNYQMPNTDFEWTTVMTGFTDVRYSAHLVNEIYRLAT